MPTTSPGLVARDALVLGGDGAMGRLMARMLAPACGRLVRADLNAEAADAVDGAALRCDVTRPDAALLDRVATSDLIVVALPVGVASAALDGLGGAFARGATVVDTLPTKAAWAADLRRVAPQCDGLGVAVMGAPSLELTGRAVGLAPAPRSARAHAVAGLLASAGARLVPVEPAAFDEIVVTVQTLVHASVLAFADAVRRLEPDWETVLALATPPFLTMAGMAARMCAAPPEVYWDLQMGPPSAPEARQALAVAVAAVDRATRTPADFEGLLGRTRDSLGASGEHLAELCHAAFSAIDARTG